jgi:hypothetical protein
MTLSGLLQFAFLKHDLIVDREMLVFYDRN